MATPSFFKQIRLSASYYTMTLLANFLGSKAYWNEITDGVYLGAMPIATKVGRFGNHGEALIAESNRKQKPLKAVISANEDWELEGYGFLGLKPVTTAFWQSQDVNHFVVDFADFGANIPVSDVKAAVEVMIKSVEEGGSVYVHCKAGRGRSLVIVMCFLMEHLKLNPEAAFELLITQRPHVSPSISQFKLIEEYRKEYCQNLKALNLNSPVLIPYRKDLKGALYSPMNHGVLAYAAVIALFGTSSLVLAVAGISCMVLALGSSKLQEKRRLRQKESVETIMITHEVLKAPAYKAGIEAGRNWKGWFKAWGDYSTYRMGYDQYLVGLKQGQEIEARDSKNKLK